MGLAWAWEKLKEGGKTETLDYFCSHTQGREGQVSGGVRRFSTPEVTREYEGVRTKKEKDILCISSPVRQLALGWRFPKLCLSLSLSLRPSLVTQTYVKTPPTEAYLSLHTMRTCVRYFLSRLFHLQIAFSIILSVFRAWQSSQSETLIHFLHKEALRLLNDDVCLCRRHKSMYFNLNKRLESFNFQCTWQNKYFLAQYFGLDLQYNYVNILNQYIYFKLNY